MKQVPKMKTMTPMTAADAGYWFDNHHVGHYCHSVGDADDADDSHLGYCGQQACEACFEQSMQTQIVPKQLGVQPTRRHKLAGYEPV